MDNHADLELTLPARPENVAVVRHALSGLGDGLPVARQALEDIKLAVSEACSNVVMHAYNGEEGPLEVLVSTGERRLSVVVRDRGKGVRPRPESPGLGVGLSLIATLADELELRTGRDDATEVRMTFVLEGAAEREIER